MIKKSYIYPKLIIISLFLFLLMFLLIGILNPSYINTDKKISVFKLMLCSLLLTLFLVLIYILLIDVKKDDNFYPSDRIKFLSYDMASKYEEVK